MQGRPIVTPRLLLLCKSKTHASLVNSLLMSAFSTPVEMISEDSIPSDLDKNGIVLIDVSSLTLPACSHVISHIGQVAKVILFNVNPTSDYHSLVSLPGIHGLLTQEDNCENLTRAVTTILDGEYWLPRQLLWKHLEKTRKAVLPSTETPKLSRKEIELLNWLIVGYSNELIAERMLISPHTVKTHFYNLYRKLNVKNRVQAASWARDHLPQAAEGAA